MTEPDGLVSGRILADRYRLVRPIGRGGMGAVWEAEQVALGRHVAVKVIRGGIDDSETARARFVREARSAAGLDSPHVVQIFDYGVDEGIPYIAMELLVGGSLADRLDREGRLSPALTLQIVRQVGKALARAHASDIVHRDLKPDNVFLCEDPDDPDAAPTVKVLDFGIAKRHRGQPLDADTRSGTMLGTPFYMSPEHARNPRQADARSDLWSLGVIAYECLVGARPFDAPSLPALSVQILVEDIPVPSEHAEVPAGFDGWLARALARNPDERFQSAREMTTALAAALGQPATLSSEAGPLIAAPARGRRTGWVIGTLAITGAAGAWWLIRAPRPTEPTQQIAPTTPTRAASSHPVEAPDVVPKTETGTEAAIEAAPETETETDTETGSSTRSSTGTHDKPKRGTKPARRDGKAPVNTTGSAKVDDLEF